ncbi:MAG: tRNA lysidine(34) synthetase TilS [Desulfobulbaceae bacterium]|nr:tRNA lysidine(34) synthetase TilS [Desulfobulbaceae bacterium]
MHPLEKKIERLVRAHALFARGDRLVVGVSGGPDSMALLHLLAALAPARDWSLLAVYVDHGLRPAESGAEAGLVRAAAARLGAEFAAEVVDVQGMAAGRKISVEHAGRELRYQVLERLAAEHDCARIVIAHTADEQAEEVLLRLIRGTGRKGLSGMAMERDGRVIRPLLGVTKAELLGYLADRDIPFAVDSSNRDRRYLRNRVRLDLLPFLAAHFNPSIGETLRQTAAILRDEEAFLAGAADRAWQETVQPAIGPGAEGEVVMRLPLFRMQPVAIRRRLLEKACWRFGQAPSFRAIEQLLSVARGEGECVHLGRGLRVQRHGDRLLFSRPMGKRSLRGNLTKADSHIFSLLVEGPGVYPLPVIGSKLVVEVQEGGMPAAVPQGADWLDGDQAPFPFLVRSVLPGDRFRPLGAPGSKKVGDFLTDAKVAPNNRWRVAVVESGGRVAALLGLRIDHRCRLTESTRRMVKIRLEPL